MIPTSQIHILPHQGTARHDAAYRGRGFLCRFAKRRTGIDLVITSKTQKTSTAPANITAITTVDMLMPSA